MSEPEELEAEAQKVLMLLEPLGSLTPTGSYVSGLMVSRDLDVRIPGEPPVTELLGRAIAIPGLTGFAYTVASAGYRVTLTVGDWRVHLSAGAPEDDTAWHRELAGRLTDDDRQAILAVKRIWRERPEYPGGVAVCTAVLEHGVRDAVEFGAWLRSNR